MSLLAVPKALTIIVDSEFKRTSSLNSPPRALLTVLELGKILAGLLRIPIDSFRRNIIILLEETRGKREDNNLRPYYSIIASSNKVIKHGRIKE
ncbi:hypothetical protein N7467_003060 [Penicillium canescens]|nr:hypothetical protein N7467_003060 [Penicillium canescens]